MSKFSKVGVIGSGSWATALVKIFSENDTKMTYFEETELLFWGNLEVRCSVF